jgi:hypothetical protein
MGVEIADALIAACAVAHAGGLPTGGLPYFTAAYSWNRSRIAPAPPW